MLSDAEVVELAALRRRAYSVDADIAGDAPAVARLSALEADVRETRAATAVSRAASSAGSATRSDDGADPRSGGHHRLEAAADASGRAAGPDRTALGDGGAGMAGAGTAGSGASGSGQDRAGASGSGQDRAGAAGSGASGSGQDRAGAAGSGASGSGQDRAGAAGSGQGRAGAAAGSGGSGSGRGAAGGRAARSLADANAEGPERATSSDTAHVSDADTHPELDATDRESPSPRHPAHVRHSWPARIVVGTAVPIAALLLIGGFAVGSGAVAPLSATSPTPSPLPTTTNVGGPSRPGFANSYAWARFVRTWDLDSLRVLARIDGTRIWVGTVGNGATTCVAIDDQVTDPVACRWTIDVRENGLVLEAPRSREDRSTGVVYVVNPYDDPAVMIERTAPSGPNP